MFRPLAIVAGLQLVSPAFGAQRESLIGDAVLGVELNEVVAEIAEASVDLAEDLTTDNLTGYRPDLERQEIIPVGAYVRTCDCLPEKSVFVDDIRDISDRFSANGNAKSSIGLSNMVWGFGQFVDHTLALSLEEEDEPPIDVETQTGVMELHRFTTTTRHGCRKSLNAHTPLADAGAVYGSDRAYLMDTLREPGTCRLREAKGGFLPVSSRPDSNGQFLLLAGDVRVSEHAFLAAQHIVWLREHNRLCEVVEKDKELRKRSVDDKFELVRNVVIAKFQQVMLTEFLPALGITLRDLQETKPLFKGNGVSMEFSIAYRLGHDLIGNDVDGIDIRDAFGSERFFLKKSGQKPTYKRNSDRLVNRIMRALSTTSANEIDGRLSDALRNFLFDEGQDLAGRNIFRGRDIGVPTYAGLAKCFGIQPDFKVQKETPDAWLGLLREPKEKGAVLPPTLRAIMLEQFHRTFFARPHNYWRTFQGKVRGFVDEIESTTYADIINANTGARVSGNVFKA